MSVISKLAVEMRLDADGYRSASKRVINDTKAMEKEAGRAQRLFDHILGTGTGVYIENAFQAAQQAVVGFVKGSVGAASDLSESLNKTAAVFGSSSAEMIKWSQNSAQNLGLSQQAALEYSSTLGNLLKGVGVSTDELPKMSKALLQTAADLGSFNNVDSGQVMEDLQSGLVGNAEPLRKYGILLNEAAVQQKAMELGLADANGEVSEAAKVQARYALIMEQVGDAQGDFAKTSGGLANGMKILRAHFVNLQAWLGGKIVPTLARAASTVNSLVQAFTVFRGKGLDPTSAALAAIEELVRKTFGKKTADQIMGAIESLTTGLQQAADSGKTFLHYGIQIGKHLVPVFEMLATHMNVLAPLILGAVAGMKAFAVIEAVVTAITAILSAELAPLYLIMLAIAAIAALVAIAWVKNWGDIQGKTETSVKAITQLFDWTVEKLEPVIRVVKLLGEYFHDVATNKIQPGNLAKLPGWLQPVAFVLARIIKTLRVFIKTWQDKGFIAALQTIPKQIRAFGRAFAGLFKSIGLDRFAKIIADDFRQISIIIGGVVSLVDNLVHGRWRAAFGDLSDIAGAALQLFLNRFRGLAALVQDVFESIPWGRIAKAIGRGLKAAGSWIKDTGGPLFLTAGAIILARLYDGASNAWDTTIKPWIAKIPGRAVDLLARGYQAFYSIGNYLIGALGSGISAAWNWLTGWFSQLPGRLVDLFAAAYNSYYNIGNYVISGLSAGLSSAWNWMVGWLTDAWNALPGFLKRLWEIASPSKVFEDIGVNAIAGLQRGLAGAMGGVNGTLQMTASGAAAAATIGANSGAGIGGGGGGGNTYTFNAGAIVINTKATDGKSIYRELLDEIQRVETGAV